MFGVVSDNCEAIMAVTKLVRYSLIVENYT